MGWQDRWTVVPAVYLVLRDGDKVLLLRRHNTGYMDGYYSMPAGHLDGGESAIKAMVREAKEEIDITLDPKDLRLVHTLHRLAQEGTHERIDMFFEASVWQGEVKNMEPHKCDELRWAAIDDLPGDQTTEVKQVLQELQLGHTYSDIGF